MDSENLVKQELQKQLEKKHKFEDTVSSLKSLLQTTGICFMDSKIIARNNVPENIRTGV
ncbi:hypothetical protein MTR_8g078130 [Medicago truncatula]|uniref:Uncharacterized protein n=1 Tax=Medicago truncatula TaxID=3880 RepID=G7LEW5_MEDTR|nr:hypothetical protein MTR_8g078130 [Medicago truncatula]